MVRGKENARSSRRNSEIGSPQKPFCSAGARRPVDADDVSVTAFPSSTVCEAILTGCCYLGSRHILM
jgi:hypothetical protein